MEGKGVKIVGEENQLGKNEGKENLREGKGEDKNKGNNGWKVQEKVAEGLISFPKSWYGNKSKGEREGKGKGNENLEGR